MNLTKAAQSGSASRRLKIHHVGARGGLHTFPHRAYEADFDVTLFEADAACIKQIEQFAVQSQASTRVLPTALGRKSGTQPFYITRSPYGSSLYRPAQLDHEFYAHGNGVDGVVSENTAIRRVAEIEVKTLDSMCIGSDPSCSPPDFISLDTQGSELDILIGGELTLTAHTLAVVSEVEFRQLYEGQPLFSDVQTYLERLGFTFVRFVAIHQMSPYRAPLGLRGDGMDTYADALFLRWPTSVAKTVATPDVALRKLVYIAVAFSQIEFALLALKLCRERDNSGYTPSTGLAYEDFLNQFAKIVESIPEIRPASFVERYDEQEMDALFTDHCENIDAWVRTSPRFMALRAQVHARSEAFDALRAAIPTSIEIFLDLHGFTTQAQILRNRRISQLTDYLRSMGVEQ